MLKRIGLLMLVVMCGLLILAGCSSSDNAAHSNDGDYNESAGMEAEKSEQAAYNQSSTVKLSASTDDSSDGGERSPQGNSSGTSSLSPIDADQGFNRKLIYTANLTMKMEDYAEAQSQLKDLIHISNGYMINFSENQTDHEIGGNYVIKIPASGFNSFIDQLNEMDPIRMQKSIKGSDVTEEYVDLESRLKAKQVVEERLLAFMDQASNADDLVSFSNELGGIQEEIERLKGRIRYLDQNVAYSTIELRMYERLQDSKLIQSVDNPLYERALNAMQSSSKFLYQLFQGIIIFLAGALPVLIVLGLIAIPVGMWMLKHKKNKKNEKHPEKKNENQTDNKDENHTE